MLNLTIELMPARKVSSMQYLVSCIRNTKYKILNTKYCKPKGFTLVELLVVISIIAVLSSLAYVNFKGATDKGRDAHRKADLKAISSALLSYYQDKDVYPPPAGNSGSCGGTPLSCTSDTGDDWIPGLTSGTTPYIQKLPKDPRQTGINSNFAINFKNLTNFFIYNVEAANISHSGWTILSTDSQELSCENGSAANAIDGNTTTIWHTRYCPVSDPYPHEIKIDLGATYVINGFQYLPRQDGCSHGWISQYEFYVSADGTNWGTPVSSGAFDYSGQTFGCGGASSPTAFIKTFAPVSGRYVRLYAPSGGNDAAGNPWASAAEIDVSGSSNNAQFISQSAPPTSMTAGQTANVSVTMKNTGTSTWSPVANYHLGSQNPGDNVNWGFHRVDLSSSVSPNSNYTFNFTVTAPSTPSTYNFQWRMVQDGIEWFGDQGANVVVSVSAAPPPPPPAPIYPAPTAPTPQTPPLSLNGKCNNADDVYCYIVSADRSTYILWTRLDNANDNETVGKLGATCNYTSPSASYNYCIEAPK